MATTRRPREPIPFLFSFLPAILDALSSRRISLNRVSVLTRWTCFISCADYLGSMSAVSDVCFRFGVASCGNADLPAAGGQIHQTLRNNGRSVNREYEALSGSLGTCNQTVWLCQFGRCVKILLDTPSRNLHTHAHILGHSKF